MKAFALFLLLILLNLACTEISYKEPQPKGIKALKEVPSKLNGRYLILESDEPVDTLVIDKTGYRLGKDEVASLSDSLILKYYKGYYFLNLREEYVWYLRVIKREKNGDIQYLQMPEFPDDEEARNQFIQKLSNDIKVTKTEVENKTYFIIEPSPKKLMELIQKGYFTGQTFKKIN
ncbi:MAG: hypothetical protein MUC73_00310 [Cyclobacteriaceae bacterium]|jgi:hypothetical protein|nr:hypothetical protein [Cyclobacteriaceae bacterium]